mgnify:CR=1 FL=1
MKTRNPRKARKRTKTARNAVLKRMVSAHLSESLRKKFSTRSLGVKVGDSVKILRGKFKNERGKVEAINYTAQKLFIEGIETQKADGTKAKVGVHSSNVLLTDVDTSDKWRKKIIERKGGKTASETKEAKK